MRCATALVLGLALTACSQFPELDATVPADGKDVDYPQLVPLEPLLARAETDISDTDQTEATVSARVAALRARASRLRGTVIDAETRARMQRGITEG